eukprot:GHVU01213523.1.p1 GENE.GHVU01213523.1~~GHVU01213523.1.p1  ORF type:complete len:448 (+),score=88.37 GHVU01213523.1:220-1563(+)
MSGTNEGRAGSGGENPSENPIRSPSIVPTNVPREPVNGTEDFDMSIPSDCNMREDLLFAKKFRFVERGKETKAKHFCDLVHVNANRFSDGGKCEKQHFFLAMISILSTQLCNLFTKGKTNGPIFARNDLESFCNMNDVVIVTRSATPGDKPINADTNEVAVNEQKEEFANVKQELFTISKFCVNVIGIAVITLFKHKHHYQLDTQAFTIKLMSAFGMNEAASSWSIKNNLADIFRNAIHHINMKTKWNFATTHVNSNAFTVRLNGFGSGNAKAGILAALHGIAKSNDAICAYFSLFGKQFADDLTKASEEKAKCAELKVAVTTCENSMAFSGQAAKMLTFTSVDTNPAVYIAAIQKIGSTLGQAKTFQSLAHDSSNVTVYKENLGKLITAFSEAQGIVKDVNFIIKMLKTEDNMGIEEFKENFLKISERSVKIKTSAEIAAERTPTA